MEKFNEDLSMKKKITIQLQSQVKFQQRSGAFVF